MRWPWVSRKEHEAALDRQRKGANEDRLRREDRIWERLFEEREVLRELIKRSHRVQCLVDHPSPGRQRFCVKLDLDEHMVHMMFEHGNDSPAIRHYSEHVGQLVARELRTLNFRRPMEPSMPRYMGALWEEGVL